MDLRQLTKSTFEPHLESTFRLHVEPDVVVEVKLVEASDLPAYEPPPQTKASIRSDPFSLVFQGPEDPTFDQGLYKLQHDDLGELEFFIAPIGWGSYEAVFN